MRTKAIDRLAEAIGYPERMPEGADPCIFRVDGAEIAAVEEGGMLRLSCPLSGDDAHLPQLAAYAAGRMLKEGAALAWGGGRAFLWQEVPADADGFSLKSFFEAFLSSCDWWRARLEDRPGEGESHPFPEMMIRP